MGVERPSNTSLHRVSSPYSPNPLPYKGRGRRPPTAARFGSPPLVGEAGTLWVWEGFASSALGGAEAAGNGLIATRLVMVAAVVV